MQHDHEHEHSTASSTVQYCTSEVRRYCTSTTTILYSLTPSSRPVQYEVLYVKIWYNCTRTLQYCTRIIQHSTVTVRCHAILGLKIFAAAATGHRSPPLPTVHKRTLALRNFAHPTRTMGRKYGWAKKRQAPAGHEYIKPVLDAMENELRNVVNQDASSLRKTEAQWPVHQINYQRTRYLYDMHFKYKKISRELLDWCVQQKLADGPLMQYWRRPGYERE